jgi:hypothetical protein
MPESGQITEDSPEYSRNEHWAVLHEDVARSNLANDARHLSPESGLLAVDSCAFSCGADVGAGESAADDIDNASPRIAVERAHVVPHREPREHAVALSLQQQFAILGDNLDGAYGSVSE